MTDDNIPTLEPLMLLLFMCIDSSIVAVRDCGGCNELTITGADGDVRAIVDDGVGGAGVS